MIEIPRPKWYLIIQNFSRPEVAPMQKNRITAAFMAIMVSFTLAACNRKDDAPVVTTAPPAAVSVTESTTAAPTTEPESETQAAPANTAATTSAQGGSKSTTRAAAASDAKPAPTSPPSSGLSGRPSTVSNATSASDLKDIDPATAASSSYDTQVKVEATNSQQVSASDFTYVDPSQYETHIFSCWSTFKTRDKVKIEASRLNEYLNYVNLPLKNTFYATNCNGLAAQYWYDPTKTYLYVDITWSYYINAEQYASCRNRAATIVSGIAKSYSNPVDRIRAVHDYLCAQTTYSLNVDGAYNCLIGGRCDCDGYTSAFQICMELLGIPCKAFATENHIFNLVQVGGSWYAVDATWDDQDSVGIVFARYFLLGRQSYAGYSMLSNLLAPSQYNCSRVGTIANESVMRSALGIPADAKNVVLGGPVTLQGQNFTDSVTFTQGNYKYTMGLTFTNVNS